MTTVHALIFGLLQGFGEMMPISSSAHLVLYPYLFRFPDPGLAFDVALHFGTLVALVGFFWREWWNILISLFKLAKDRKITDFSQKLAILLLIASVPGAIFGALLDSYAETAFRNPLLIAFFMVVMGCVLWYADHHDRGQKDMADISYKNSLGIGLAQALAIIPGVSRSGVTISAGLFAGIKREDAAKFSFLMSSPIIAGASMLKLKDVNHAMLANINFWIALLASMISSMVAILFVLKFVRKYHFDIFVYYRFALAAVVALVYLSRGV